MVIISNNMDTLNLSDIKTKHISAIKLFKKKKLVTLTLKDINLI